MLTNIVAAITVSVVTNVSEQVTGYARHVPDACPEGRMGCLVNHWKGVDPTHKTITTNVVEITILTFDWLGQKREFKSEKVLDTKSVLVALQWVVTTNSPAEPKMEYGVDNFIRLNNTFSEGTLIFRP